MVVCRMSLNVFPLGILVLIVFGCTSLKTPHQRFIEWADGKVSLKLTLEQLDYDPKYPLGRYLADYHNLATTNVRSDGFIVYHYARKIFTGDFCHYHLIVDPNSKIVVGWGFDTEFGDPRKSCGTAG